MKVCIQCQTENSAEYKYCKFCGAELPCVDRKPVWESGDWQNQDTSNDSIPVSEDISIYEMNVFVGKNNDRIVPEFVNMQKKNKKVSWCWPVFLLGLFFGFFGMAAWFFYRKMNKIGFILLGVSIVLQAANLIANFGAMTQLYGDVFSVMYSYIDTYAADPSATSAWLNDYINELALRYSANAITIFSFIEQYVGGLAMPIVMGLFGHHFYKEHALEKIAKIKNEYGGTPAYIMHLNANGGTSAARAIGAVIVAFCFVALISVAPIIAFFMGV